MTVRAALREGSLDRFRVDLPPALNLLPGEAVTVTYHLGRLMSPGTVARRAGAVARAVGAPAPKEVIGKLLVGAATAADGGGFRGRLARPVRDRLLDAWHDRVRVVLTDDDLFSVAAAPG